LPDGKRLITLRDAADYIPPLPKKASALSEWQAAIEALMLVSRGGPTMLARIGVMKGLNYEMTCVAEAPSGARAWALREPRSTPEDEIGIGE
jgi:hypothetical protein